MNPKTQFNKKIALFGGAGPWASAYAHTTLIRLSQWDYGAIEDQEYPEILHVSVPLRGFSAEGIEDEKLARQQVLDTFDFFKAWGADIAVIACNSLHAYYDELSARTSIQIMHLPRLGANALAERGVKAVGVLCSESALRHGLHKDALEGAGIQPILPTREQQDRVNRMIKQIMGGDNTVGLAQDFRQLGREFKAAGAQALLSGCTELSYLSTKVVPDVPVVDCLGEALSKTLKLAALSPVLGS